MPEKEVHQDEVLTNPLRIQKTANFVVLMLFLGENHAHIQKLGDSRVGFNTETATKVFKNAAEVINNLLNSCLTEEYLRWEKENLANAGIELIKARNNHNSSSLNEIKWNIDIGEFEPLLATIAEALNMSLDKLSSEIDHLEIAFNPFYRGGKRIHEHHSSSDVFGSFTGQILKGKIDFRTNRWETLDELIEFRKKLKPEPKIIQVVRDALGFPRKEWFVRTLK